MKNPYEVLGVSQDISDTELNDGFKLALMKNMKSKQYSPADLMAARQQLTAPSRRLAADFMYPARPRAKRPKALVWPVLSEIISLDSLKLEAYDSL